MASITVDLPEPVGPTSANTSVSVKSTSVGSRKAPKPRIRSRIGRISRHPRWPRRRGARRTAPRRPGRRCCVRRGSRGTGPGGAARPPARHGRRGPARRGRRHLDVDGVRQQGPHLVAHGAAPGSVTITRNRASPASGAAAASSATVPDRVRSRRGACAARRAGRAARRGRRRPPAPTATPPPRRSRRRWVSPSTTPGTAPSWVRWRWPRATYDARPGRRRPGRVVVEHALAHRSPPPKRAPVHRCRGPQHVDGIGVEVGRPTGR